MSELETLAKEIASLKKALNGSFAIVSAHKLEVQKAYDKGFEAGVKYATTEEKRQMEWRDIGAAPKDGTIVKLHHSNATETSILFAANGRWDGQRWQMSCYPFSKCGRFLITGQPDLWQPQPPKEPTP